MKKFALLALAAIAVAGCSPSLETGRVFMKHTDSSGCVVSIEQIGKEGKRLTDNVYVPCSEWHEIRVGDWIDRNKGRDRPTSIKD